MAIQITISIAEDVNDDINRVMVKKKLTNKSEFVESLIRKGLIAKGFV